MLHTIGDLELGGAQKLTRYVVNNLDPDEFEVALLTFGGPGAYGPDLEAAGVEVIPLGLRRSWRGNSPVQVARAARTLLGTLRRRWDVVHTHLFISSVVVTLLARLFGARALGTAHRIYRPRVQPTVERLVSHLQDRIVVDSAAVRDILQPATRIPLDKYVVIYNGIETDELDEAPSAAAARDDLGLPRDAFVVTEVAHLRQHKGQANLVDAVATLVPRHDQLHLVLVGDGPDRPILEARVDEGGLAGRIHVLGARPDLAANLSACDVLALPSTYEGFGIVQVEAMYLEKPVVATDRGGSVEVVEDGVTGLLVPFGDVEGLVAAIERLIDDPSLRRRMGAAGRARVLERFTVERMAAAYADLYREVVGRGVR